MSQRWTCIVYKIDMGANSSLMPFTLFKNLLPKSTLEQLHTKRSNAMALKTCKNSNIEQFGIYTVKLQHKDNLVKCTFFEVPADGPLLLGMPDIEVPEIQKIKCEVIDS